MTKENIGQNKRLDEKTVKELNEKPVAKGQTFAFPDGTVVEAENLGDAQKKHADIIKKKLKIIKK